MLPVYSAHVMKQWDEYTILHEPIASIDLMERAANQCVDWLVKHVDPHVSIALVCGNGNNGGDGLAIARMLFHHHYTVEVFVTSDNTKSHDHLLNLERLESQQNIKISRLEKALLLKLHPKTLIVDCIFGTGLNKAVEGFWEEIIRTLNALPNAIVSIDVPSGMMADPDHTPALETSCIVNAESTLTFQSPKLNMLLAPFGEFCGKINILDIGLHKNFPLEHTSDYEFLQIEDIASLFKKRKVFSHKGSHGHALIMAGNDTMPGAAGLCSRAALRSGVGKLTLMSTSLCIASVSTNLPELITATDFSELSIGHFSAIGVGPGIGTGEHSAHIIKNLLSQDGPPLVLDADALNLIANHAWIDHIPKNTIITPHPTEFDRLAGHSISPFERLLKAGLLAKKLKITVVLKGAYTAICLPDGRKIFNSSGNPGMAKAGSGDALTGIITSLLAQGYSEQHSAMMGCYIHGKAGDFAAKKKSQTGMLASDLIEALGDVFNIFEGNAF